MTRHLLKLLTAFALSGVAAISMASDSNFIVDELRAVHSELTDARRWVDSDIRGNLSHRWESAPRRLTDSGLRFAESELEGLSWVTDVNLHRITRNGNFLAGFGASGVGLLLTDESYALGFQPSGEWLDGSDDDFASFGVFGRKAVGDWGVLGANVFGDYASDSEFGDFSRWSIGADFQSELADLRGNWYSEGTGFKSRRIENGEIFAYSPSGVDAELNLRWHGVSEWTGFAEYEKWDGRFGKADTREVGFGVTYRPLGGGVLAGLEVDAGYFTALGDDDRLDLRLAYSRVLGGDNRVQGRNFGFGVQSALVAPVARKRKIEIAESVVLDPDFLDAESRIYRERDGLFANDRRPFLMEIHSRCTLAYDFSGITYEQKTSAELHEQAENPAQFDDLCDTINKTANIRTLDSNGNLATHRAVSGAALDNLKLLIIAGVRATATNTAGKTPLDLAQRKHSATTDSELRETLSTIAMVIRASGGECAAESGTLCGIEYDSLYGEGNVIDYIFIDYVTIPSTFKGSSIYQLHHPEYGKMTVVRHQTPNLNPRVTVTPGGEIRIKEGAILKWGGYSSQKFWASNEHLPYPAYVIVPISVSIISHPQPWTTPPIRKVVPNYTGAYFTVTATPPSGQLGYSFGPGESAAYRFLSYSYPNILNVTDGDSRHSHLDFMFADDLLSYNRRGADFSSDIEAATWFRNVVQMTTADQRLAATYQNGAFAVSLNQAIGQGDPQVHAVHMFVDPYDYANETQTLNFTISTPSIPGLAVYTVGANHTGLIPNQPTDDELRDKRYAVIANDPQLAMNSAGQLRADSVIPIGGVATLAAKMTSPDLLGTLTITVRVLSRCTPGNVSVLQTSTHPNSAYQRKGRELYRAAGNNNLAKVCQLISEGADPDYETGSGFRPIGNGAYSATVAIARALILHGATAHYTQGVGYTPMHNTAPKLNIEYARVLLTNGASATYKTRHRVQPMHQIGAPIWATRAHYLEYFNLLIAYGADVNDRGEHGITALMRAASSGNLAKAEALVLDLEADKNVVNDAGDDACSYALSRPAIRKLLKCPPPKS